MCSSSYPAGDRFSKKAPESAIFCGYKVCNKKKKKHPVSRCSEMVAHVNTDRVSIELLSNPAWSTDQAELFDELILFDASLFLKKETVYINSPEAISIGPGGIKIMHTMHITISRPLEAKSGCTPCRKPSMDTSALTYFYDMRLCGNFDSLAWEKPMNFRS